MSVNYFTDQQVAKLRKNPYVKNVSNKAITYEEKFKEYFYLEKAKGFTPSQIFEKAGFDIKVVGQSRIIQFSRRIKIQAARDEGFSDTRKGKSGRHAKKALTDEEIIERLKQKNKILQQENDFLKRVRFINKKQIAKASKMKPQKINSD